jgi:hypothetical protein
MGLIMFATSRSVSFFCLCLALLCGPGCGGKSTAATPSETEAKGATAKSAATTKVPPAAEDDDSAALASSDSPDPKTKEKGSWRWKGKRDLCYFVVENKCFADEKSACEAAECDSGCIVDKGAPAKVTCKEFIEAR